MKIGFVSDLHLDIGGHAEWKLHKAEAVAEWKTCDVVVLAGDLDNDIVSTIAFIDEVKAELGPTIPVLFVPGNHEFYKRPMATVFKMLDDANVSYFGEYNPSIVINDVLFVGSTLWTDFNLYGPDTINWHMSSAEHRMSDYYHIWVDFVGGEKLTTAYTRNACINATNNMSVEVESKMRSGAASKVVVITHHGPSVKSIDPFYDTPGSRPLNGAYASGILDSDNSSYNAVLANNVDVWIHAHTHTTVDYTIGGCRIVTNPRGYTINGLNENPGFMWTKTLTV